MMDEEKRLDKRPTRPTRRDRNRIGILLISLLLLVTMAVGGTVAWLLKDTQPVVNTFTPAHVTCEVTEDFNGTVKKNVNVRNTGDTDAYIRVKLISYRVNEDGQHIGGKTSVPTFTLGSGWVENDGYYYYTYPVAPGEKPTNALVDNRGIILQEYTDADGGKQVIEVMAEAIQSTPAEAVGQSWGVTIEDGRVKPYLDN